MAKRRSFPQIASKLIQETGGCGTTTPVVIQVVLMPLQAKAAMPLCQ
jgi:hypothetical protein